MECIILRENMGICMLNYQMCRNVYTVNCIATAKQCSPRIIQRVQETMLNERCRLYALRKVPQYCSERLD